MNVADQLSEFARAKDPFRTAPSDLAAMQLEAARERFAERRKQIKVLDKRAAEAGITEINSLNDLVPLLFAHTNYKSYPEQFVDNGKWQHMNAWLQTLSTYPTSNVNISGVQDVDDWLHRLEEAGHHVYASSGTSGKSSFLNQSAKDKELCFAACFNAFDISNPTITPNKDRTVFTQMPPSGPHKMAEVAELHYRRVAAPGKLYRSTEDPIYAMQTIRPAQLRRKIAAGTAKPEEIVAFETETAALQKQRADEMEAWYDLLAEKHRDPIVFGMMWGGMYNAMLALKARGVKAGDFHPETVLSTGGGVKGAKLPEDYRQQIFDYLGLDERRLCNSYAMVEMSGFNAYLHEIKAYAMPPWLIPLILDKAGEKLLNPENSKGVVEGRMAFFDVLADGRWGGIISGDKVVVDFGSNEDGVKTPIVRQVARYADLDEGEDKLSCAGTIDSYVRGAMNVAA
jgi:hypothetical protein